MENNKPTGLGDFIRGCYFLLQFCEKYAFQFIPDVTRLPGFPKNVTEQAVADYFGLDDHDRQHISGLHKKDYTRFST